MIKICLPNAASYYDLQEKYLKMVVKFVVFDECDILEVPQIHEKCKSRNTAQKLREVYPQLYRFLFEDIESVKKENLRRILVGPNILPDSFLGNNGTTMRHDFEDIISQCQLPEGKKQRRNAIRICKEIFQYDRFMREQQDAYELLRELDVRVCPYCNRIYTVTLPSKKELEDEEKFKTTRPTFDHFYSKDEFPYLALSLFNLIPSCHICNMNKGTSKDQIIYPYDEEFGQNAVIRLIPDLSEGSYRADEGVLNFLHGDSDRFHIRFMGNYGISLIKDAPLEYRLLGIEDEEYRKRIENSINLFRLERLYNEHRREIKDILRNRYYFNEAYIENVICPIIQQKMCQKRFISSQKGSELEDEELVQMQNDPNPSLVRSIAMDMFFFTYMRKEEWGDRPLSKLISDVLNQISDV